MINVLLIIVNDINNVALYFFKIKKRLTKGLFYFKIIKNYWLIFGNILIDFIKWLNDYAIDSKYLQFPPFLKKN